MKLSILLGALVGFGVGYAALARATEPCDPQTYLTVETITKNGTNAPLPAERTHAVSSAVQGYSQKLYDPVSETRVTVHWGPQ